RVVTLGIERADQPCIVRARGREDRLAVGRVLALGSQDERRGAQSVQKCAIRARNRQLDAVKRPCRAGGHGCHGSGDSRNGRETSPPSCASQRSAPELVIHETSLAFYACECQRLSFRWAPSGPRRGASLARLLETARPASRHQTARKIR